MKISVQELLQELVNIAEKSSQLAQICRAESDGVFKTLIQEKLNEKEKNPRFLHDYKTFADVLIQEMATVCLNTKFPGISKKIYGEEDNHFENKLGQEAHIHIDPLQTENTYKNLIKILNEENSEFARKLVQVIYSKTNCDDTELNKNFHNINLFLEQSEIGIWIDPIDSTSEYIQGQWQEQTSLAIKGLHCVTCLFGVFDIKSGLPILGVLNQPFYKKINQSTYEGRCVWGFNIDQICRSNIADSLITSESGIILVGRKERTELKEKLNSISKAIYMAGAGYKLLRVAVGEADLLFTSSRSTYFWDTCAVHAILRSLGGGIIPFDNFMQLTEEQFQQHDDLQIKYKLKTPETVNIECNNSKGLIAYRSLNQLKKTIDFLRTTNVV